MCTLVIYNTVLLGEECNSLAVKGVVVQVETCLNKSESKLGCNEGWYLNISSECPENFHYFTHPETCLSASFQRFSSAERKKK